ncbi:MAG: FHA domain-containing protein, partial [Planctomycetota bacterium]
MMSLEPRPDDYDARYAVTLRGTGTLGDGETIKICLGESAVCGRSRHCTWSLKHTPAFLQSEDGTRSALRKTLAWRATSRQHCRLTYVAPDMNDIENLSPNGTLVDGHRVDRIVLTDCRERAHEIRLGPRGVVLELR